MAYLTIPAYEANMPFIYAYYAEDDTRSALPILTRLYNEGLRMWSWNGCEHPSDFRATQRINACTALIIFLSDNLNRAVDKGEFEALAALKCNKVKYFIRLSDVQLPFDWGRSDTNIIIDYVRSNEAAFWLNIYDSTLIEKCRGPWPEHPLSGALPSLDEFYADDINDEYSALSRIIDNVPRVDRYGAPVNAEDVALFAGVSDDDEEKEIPTVQEETIPPDISELNRSSMEDLLGMLDDIAFSTRARVDAIEEDKRRRMEEQLAASQKKTFIPFEPQDVALEKLEEPPVPEISFGERSNLVERAAKDMFGASDMDDDSLKKKPNEIREEEKEPELVINESEKEEEKEAEPEPPQVTLEAFIDDLVGLPPLSDDISDFPEPVIRTMPEPGPEPVPSPEPVYNINRRFSDIDIVLPDDRETDTSYIYHINYEGDTMPSAEEVAQQAKRDRQAFERAIHHAAFKVTGKLLAKPVKRRRVSLKLRRQTIVKLDAKKKEPPQSLILKVKKDAPPAKQTMEIIEKHVMRYKKKKPVETAAPVLPAAPAIVPSPAPIPDAVITEESAPSKRKHSHKPAPAEPITAAPVVPAPAAPAEESVPSKRRHSHRPAPEITADAAAQPAPIVPPAPTTPAPAANAPASEESTAARRRFSHRPVPAENTENAVEAVPEEPSRPKFEFMSFREEASQEKSSAAKQPAKAPKKEPVKKEEKVEKEEKKKSEKKAEKAAKPEKPAKPEKEKKPEKPKSEPEAKAVVKAEKQQKKEPEPVKMQFTSDFKPETKFDEIRSDDIFDDDDLPTKRKKKFPHNPSAALAMLRELRAAQKAERPAAKEDDE